MSVSVLGLPIQNVTMDEAMKDVTAFLDQRESKIVVTPNAEILQLFSKDSAVKEALLKADYVIPDGIGVIIAAKRLGTPLKEKVAGVDLGTKLLKVCAETGKKVFFLGGKPGVAEQAKEKLLAQYPTIQIVGTRDGYFKAEDEAQIVEEINASQADMLFVCLGAPKQEMFMANHKQDLKIGVMLGLGGTLDIIAGNLKRAPRWMITCRMEWLYRLIKEPRRFKRMISLPFFLLSVKKK